MSTLVMQLKHEKWTEHTCALRNQYIFKTFKLLCIFTVFCQLLIFALQREVSPYVTYQSDSVATYYMLLSIQHSFVSKVQKIYSSIYGKLYRNSIEIKNILSSQKFALQYSLLS